MPQDSPRRGPNREKPSRLSTCLSVAMSFLEDLDSEETPLLFRVYPSAEAAVNRRGGIDAEPGATPLSPQVDKQRSYTLPYSHVLIGFRNGTRGGIA